MAFNLKIRYNDIPRNRVVRSVTILQQESDDDRELGGNDVVVPVPMASGDHV